MNKTRFIFIFIVLSLSSCKEEPFTIKEPFTIINDFFYTYKNEGSEKALSEIFQTNSQLFKESRNKIDEVLNKLNNITSVVGKYHGFELICEKGIGSSLKQYSYLVKYEYQPLRFRFTFYKINDNWKLISFRFDDDLVEELSEASKVYFL